MSFEQFSHFADFLGQPEEKKHAEFAEILIRNAFATQAKDWPKKDAEIILGLASEQSFTKAAQHSHRVRPLPSDSHIYPSTFTLLDDYLDDPQVNKALTDYSNQKNPLHQELKADPKPLLEKLRQQFCKKESDVPFVLPRRQTSICGSLFTNMGHTLWKNRNYGQRVAVYGLAPLSITAAVLGVITSESAALTTAGTTMAKFLPGFVTAFGASHAIPPAALAFYALAATLAAAALVLLLASTVYRCASSKNKNYAHLDAKRYFTTAR